MENLENNKVQVRIRKVTFMFLLLVIFVALGVSLYYNITLQEQIYERDNLIEKLTQKDSILNQIMDVQYDSITGSNTYSYRVKDGKVQKYNSLAIELDKSKNEYNLISERQKKIIEENNQNINDYNSLANSFIKLNSEHNDMISSFNKLAVEYNDLVRQQNKIITNLNQVNDSLSTFKTIVALTKSNFDIKYNIKIDGNSKKISLQAEKLDSALVLLPYFRDRLTLDAEKKVWIINTGRK